MDELSRRGRGALENILSQAAQRDKLSGYVGLPDGAGGHTVNIPHHPGYSYVRGSDGIEGWVGECINIGALPDPANLLEIKREGGVLVAVAPNAANAAYVYGANAAGAASTPQIQTVQTGNAAVVASAQIDGGRLTLNDPDGTRYTGLKVRISAYRHRGGWWDGTTPITLTATATSSKHAWVLVGVNTKTNAITQALTADRGLAQTLLRVDMDSVIAANPDVDWRGAVDVANGATSLDELKIVDVRNHGETRQKSNYSATAAPGVGDDSADGYGVGSVWIDTTADNVYQCTDATAGAANWAHLNATGGGSSPDYILIQDVKSSGTQAGTFTSGSWQTRVLNTEVDDAGGHCSLSSNQFTLAAGTYRISASAPGVYCSAHQARLRNTSDSATTLVGSSEWTTDADSGVITTRSLIVGQFTIASSKTFEIQHRCATTRATEGLGIANGFGENEIYTIVELWKLS